jgi:hypothetical protein
VDVFVLTKRDSGSAANSGEREEFEL